MSRFKIGIAALGLAIGILATLPARAWERGPVDVLAVLPDVTQNVQSSVEGLTVGPDGNIYVPTFGFNTTGSTRVGACPMPGTVTNSPRGSTSTMLRACASERTSLSFPHTTIVGQESICNAGHNGGRAGAPCLTRCSI